MPVVTQKRSRSGRSGSLRSTRRILWTAITACKHVLLTTDDETTILATTRILTRASRAYARLLAEEKAAP